MKLAAAALSLCFAMLPLNLAFADCDPDVLKLLRVDLNEKNQTIISRQIRDTVCSQFTDDLGGSGTVVTEDGLPLTFGLTRDQSSKACASHDDKLFYDNRLDLALSYMPPEAIPSIVNECLQTDGVKFIIQNQLHGSDLISFVIMTTGKQDQLKIKTIGIGPDKVLTPVYSGYFWWRKKEPVLEKGLLINHAGTIVTYHRDSSKPVQITVYFDDNHVRPVQLSIDADKKINVTWYEWYDLQRPPLHQQFHCKTDAMPPNAQPAVPIYDCYQTNTCNRRGGFFLQGQAISGFCAAKWGQGSIAVGNGVPAMIKGPDVSFQIEGGGPGYHCLVNGKSVGGSEDSDNDGATVAHNGDPDLSGQNRVNACRGRYEVHQGTFVQRIARETNYLYRTWFQ